MELKNCDIKLNSVGYENTLLWATSEYDRRGGMLGLDSLPKVNHSLDLQFKNICPSEHEFYIRWTVAQIKVIDLNNISNAVFNEWIVE